MVMTYDDGSRYMTTRPTYTRDAVAAAPKADPANVHIHLHDQEMDPSSPCGHLAERVADLEESVATLLGNQPDDEPDEPDESEDGVVRRPTTLPREQWSGSRDQKPDDDAGSGGAKNRGIEGTPKVDVPESKLPDIADINRKNTAFWAGASTNNYTPNQGNSINEAARTSTTPKQMEQKTFGTTDQAKFFQAQEQRAARLVQAIEAKNLAFYAKRGGH